MDEQEIIKKIIAGDEAAFKHLVQTHQAQVVNTAFGLVHNLADAEDIAQEVFIQMFRSINTFKADSKISTWLYRIAINRSLNFIRDNKKHRWIESFDELVSAKNAAMLQKTAHQSDEPDYQLENRQRAAMLHEAIDSLPANQRTAYTLNKYEDLSYREIAEVMELSVSAIEALLHRARKNLQKKIYHYYHKKCL